jgi:outer membrane lipoprotein-sorting protein
MQLTARLSARLLIAALTLTAGVTIAADEGGTLGNLMALLAQRRHGVADFTQTQYLAVLKQPQRSEGVLSYDAPDHLEQRTLKPHPQTAVLDHGVLTLTRGSRQRTVRLDEYPQLAPLIDSVRATLAGDLPANDASRHVLRAISTTGSSTLRRANPGSPQVLSASGSTASAIGFCRSRCSRVARIAH